MCKYWFWTKNTNCSAVNTLKEVTAVDVSGDGTQSLKLSLNSQEQSETPLLKDFYNVKILNVIDNVNLIKKDIITICNEESADIYRYKTPFDPQTIDFLYDKGAEFFRNRI